MSPDGPRQPTLAARQGGSYRGYTGRGDNPIAKAASDPKENLRAFTPSIALTEMNTARYAALPHPNAEPRGRNARAAADCAPLPFSFAHSPKTWSTRAWRCSLSSGVLASCPLEPGLGPDTIPTYCLPLTSNVIGGAEKPGRTVIFHSSSSVVSS